MDTTDYFAMRAKNDLNEDSGFAHSLALSCEDSEYLK